jgi:hypothetical protein
MEEAATATQTRDAPTRLSVNLSREVADVLKSLTARRGITVTEAIRRAISTQAYIEDALDRGAKILISEPDGSVRELVFMQ